ncbi:MAG: cation diffusion facilitator family transporter [Kiloniellales bacterium]|nr:cation diffusion facilitator family transporter [Kiloniellales bacterium]MDJ0970506.1 cation diffusion facilitator family transporter [Kiloniellales bacterium]
MPSETQAAQAGMNETARLMRLATYASVSTAVSLIVLKLGAWVLTDSISLLSTLIDSILDAVASLVSLLAVRTALTPADREHRFGHGKAEPLAALGQAAFITGSAVFLLIEALHLLFDPRPIQNPMIGIVVMLISIGATAILVLFQRYVIRRTNSVVVRADSLHYLGDLLVNMAVIVALLGVTQLGWTILDPIFAIGIAAYILKTAWSIASESLHMLMDRELPDDDRARIGRIVRAHPEVVDMHDLRTRLAGPQTFIQLHLELNGDLSLWDAHTISDQVEAELKSAFPGAEVIIHEDPHGIVEPQARFGSGA